MRIAHCPIYHLPLPPKHRFPMAKYDLLPQQLLYEGTAETRDFFAPRPLELDLLFLTHCRDYYERLRAGALTAKEVRAIGFPLSQKLVDRELVIARGTLDCARASRADGVALNVAGGTHHSFRDRGEGFCVFNDIAVAANAMLATGEASSILIVDLDVHQGNGTAALFADEPRVFTLSVHGERNYPLRKVPSDLDIGLPDHTGDATYLDVVREWVPRLIRERAPDQVFYLAGVDVLEADKLGRLGLSIQGCRERDRVVMEACAKTDTPLAVCMGGGYAERLAAIVEAHANTYRVARSVFG